VTKLDEKKHYLEAAVANREDEGRPTSTPPPDSLKGERIDLTTRSASTSGAGHRLIRSRHEKRGGDPNAGL